MLSKEEFAGQLKNAYDHVYDLVHLRTHPLTDLLVPDSRLGRKEKAWRLHSILLDAIDELDPGPQAPVYSREWRRHRLMTLRYADGLDPPSVAEELAISLRHYYREQKTAIGAIAHILWDRRISRQSTPYQEPIDSDDQAFLSRLELLRLEAGRLAQLDRHARIDDVVEGVLSVLQDVLRQRQLDVSLTLPDSMPEVAVDHNLLRQLLLGMLGYLVGIAERATIRLAAQIEPSAVRLSATVDQPISVHPMSREELDDRLSSLYEMAGLSGIHVSAIRSLDATIGFEVQLPTISQRSVLVVDDNEDVLELFRRYLTSNGYHVVTARTAEDALALARQLRPHAITLDLMMPDQDGWDLLQTLLHHPETDRIPTIVCTVLKQKDLALSLGAVLFLEKPVTEKALISALDALRGNRMTET